LNEIFSQSKNFDVLQAWVCDGDSDCEEEEEEDEERSAADEAPALCRTVCARTEFRCANNRCTLSHFYCDGDNDCGDNSDEPPECDYRLPPHRHLGGRNDQSSHDDGGDDTCQEPEYFACANGLCVARPRRCDGRNDCGDFSDELSCGKEESRGIVAASPPRGPAAAAPRCPSGYILAADGSRCKSNSTVQPKIMFSNRYYIRMVDLQGNSEIFAKNQSNAVALGRICDQQIFYQLPSSLLSIFLAPFSRV
jgi:hypothetical protein